MASLMALGAQAIITLIIFGFLSNTNPSALDNIDRQFFFLTCPLPLSNGIDYLNGTIAYNVDINGDSTTIGGNVDANPFTQDTGVTAGTFYECNFDPLSAPPGLSTSTTIKEYGANCFSVVPCGFFGYVGDYLSSIIMKVQVMFTLITFYLTPVNFEILGFTLADMTPLAQIAILSLYGFDYIMIGIFIYKTLSPYTGVH